MQISNFNPPLGLTSNVQTNRYSSSQNTQRVGQNENIAKETARNLLTFVSYEVRRNALGLEIEPLGRLLLEETKTRLIRYTISNNETFNLENFILGQLLKQLEPKSQQGFVETLRILRGYIAQAFDKSPRDPLQYTDGTIVYLKELLRARSAPVRRFEGG